MVIKMAEKLKAYLSKNTDLLYFSKSAMVTDMCKKALEDLYIKKAETMSVLLDEFKVDKKSLVASINYYEGTEEYRHEGKLLFSFTFPELLTETKDGTVTYSFNQKLIRPLQACKD
jgi:hypothetical protein